MRAAGARQPALMAAATTYVTSLNRLELDGQDAGLLRSVEGGEPYGEVVQEGATTPGAVVGKRLGPVHYADIAIECSLTPSAPLANWIGATLGRRAPRHDGAIVELDRNYDEVSRLVFHHAVIHEIEFPALDAADTQQGYLTLRIAPESTRRHAGSGTWQAIGSDKSPVARDKGPRTCDFQLKVDGLTGSFVSKVHPLVVRQLLTESLAEDGSPRLTPGGLEIPDLVVTLREATDWYAWRDAFMVDRTGAERTGTLEYLAQDMKKVLARIAFSGMGIHSLVAERIEEGAAAPRRLRASMYCENLSYGLPLAMSTTSTAMEPTAPSRVAVIAPLASRRPFALTELA
jgi:hypothetical protein